MSLLLCHLIAVEEGVKKRKRREGRLGRRRVKENKGEKKLEKKVQRKWEKKKLKKKEWKKSEKGEKKKERKMKKNKEGKILWWGGGGVGKRRKGDHISKLWEGEHSRLIEGN